MRQGRPVPAPGDGGGAARALRGAPGRRRGRVLIEGAAPRRSTRGRRIAGYAFALGAGVLWGATGPLSTLLYAEGEAITGVSFWPLLLGTVALALYGLLFQRELFRVDRRGLLLVGLGGGLLVALFEVANQFAITGAGVASAAALLYAAPIVVALLARGLLHEALTPLRLLLAAVVGIGAVFAVQGGPHGTDLVGVATPRLALGVAGGLLAALSYAGTTLLARYAVPRYGVAKVLLLEVAGGTVVLGIVLPLAGRAPVPPATGGGWAYLLALAAGTVLLATYCFFSGAKRIEAAPTALAAAIEPVVGTVLAVVLLSQYLTVLGWFGLLLVAGGVTAGYLDEARASAGPPPTESS